MANEKRLIYAEEAVELINGLESLPWEEETEGLVNSLTTVDAVEVVHGRWEEDKPPEHHIFAGVNVIYRCSECNNRFIHDTHYCPNCGAKMDGGNDYGKAK